MQFVTHRFTCELLDDKWAAEAAALYQDEKVMRLIGTPLTKAESERVTSGFIEANRQPWPTQKVWVITCNYTKAFCGIQMLRKHTHKNSAEIGIMLARKMNGKGAAREAMGALVDYGISHVNLDRIVAQFQIRHLATRRLVTQLGFVKKNDSLSMGSKSELTTYTFERLCN
ncbi:GNAT family N-acetyltransferase [Alteromonas sp. DY56-G5]|jgi:RimJ/RimL family protein N-acetyltransferase|uniref:GNAT family N-acetyltransferase n=1 Tax=Alteromonas TaxID=226 RepID=UPI000777946D|nr:MULTISPECIES: GNAT family N-acetyltransferase [Alteromonas]MAL71326.1 N-acetyltransferase [Alteromonas sp.]MEC9023348.1 GNAT family N-acetyltransferase [Pseudomonadota bacterium]AMN11234.1 acetyltransferase [Alteromonas macleodii]MAW03808.1 N-acetyltransferase [Alteromonas sp.]MCP4281366.1 GNAT family N-acetyltransferase [Alteromonas sp.]|tara:strand:- start:456 stop:968 length:513 start_codon:yes stop_codon:yes gene_type:complete